MGLIFSFSWTSNQLILSCMLASQSLMQNIPLIARYIFIKIFTCTLTTSNKTVCHVFHRIKFIGSEWWWHFGCMQAKSFHNFNLLYIRGTFAAALTEQLARHAGKYLGHYCSHTAPQCLDAAFHQMLFQSKHDKSIHQDSLLCNVCRRRFYLFNYL